jgi:tape measure domain-containing protein
MEDLALLGLEVRSDGVVVATDRLHKFRGAAGQAEKAAGGLSATARRLQGLLAVVVGSVVVQRTLALADAYTSINNALRVMSTEQTDVNALFHDLLGIANETRTPLESMAQLYQRASLASKELGASQAEMLQFTENVGKALALQGGSSNAATGALLQLSQALGGGTVRAEEFNSILEGAFPIAKAAAAGLDAAGGSVMKLRQLIADGKVTSDEFFRAILSQTDELNAAFAKTSPTISQAFTVLRNNLISAVGSLDQTVGATLGLGRVILVLAENVQRLVVWIGTAAVIFAGQYAAGLALAALRTTGLVGALTLLRGALIRTGIGVLIVGAGELVYQFLNLVRATGTVGEALSLVGDVGAEVFERVRMHSEGTWHALAGHALSIKAEFLEAWAAIVDGVASAVNSVGSFVAKMVNSIIEKIETMVNASAQALNILPGVDIGSTSLDRVEHTKIGGDLGDSIRADAGAARGASDVHLGQADALWKGATATLESLEKLNTVVDQSKTGMIEAAAAAGALGDALGGDGGGAGGGAAGKSVKEGANEAVRLVKKLAEEEARLAETTNQELARSSAEVFNNFVTGAKSAKESITDLIAELGRMATMQGFQQLFGGLNLGGGGIGNFLQNVFGFGGTRAFGGDVDAGKAYWVGERGPERVVPRQNGRVVQAGGGSGRPATINVHVSGARGNSEIMAMVQAGVSGGLREYDALLPDRVAGISADPFFRG